MSGKGLILFLLSIGIFAYSSSSRASLYNIEDDGQVTMTCGADPVRFLVSLNDDDDDDNSAPDLSQRSSKWKTSKKLREYGLIRDKIQMLDLPLSHFVNAQIQYVQTTVGGGIIQMRNHQWRVAIKDKRTRFLEKDITDNNMDTTVLSYAPVVLPSGGRYSQEGFQTIYIVVLTA